MSGREATFAQRPLLGQMSMPKPVSRNMATAAPLGPPGAQTAQKQHAGLLELDAQPSPPESVFPRARHGRSLPRCGVLTFRTPTRHRAPNQEPGRILIPGDGAAGDQGAQNRPVYLAMALRDARGLSRLNDFLALWSQAQMPSCNRHVTSTSVYMAKPGSASAPRGHARLQSDKLSLARTISDRICAPRCCSFLQAPDAPIRRICARSDRVEELSYFHRPSLRVGYPRLCWSRVDCGNDLGRARPAGARRGYCHGACVRRGLCGVTV